MRGVAFWAVTVAEFDLTPSELVVLAETCRTLDVIDRLEAAISADGVTVEGSRGQSRTHPALTEVRGHRSELRQLIDRLNLPDPVGVDMSTGAQVKASKAARARWGNVSPIRRGGDGEAS